MADVQLHVDPRLVTGKKVKALRKQGIVPAHLYGRDTESLALQAQTADLVSLLKAASRNAIIDLQINGEEDARPVVMRGVQRNAITDELMHVDFFQISLTERLTAEVSIVLTGESPAVTIYGGVLLHSLDTLSVEALPAEIPPQIVVDISVLEELEDARFVRDLDIPAGVEVLADPDQVVVKVSPPKLVVEEAEVAEGEEGEEAEAAVAAEEAEAAAPGEGDESEESD